MKTPPTSTWETQPGLNPAGTGLALQPLSFELLSQLLQGAQGGESHMWSYFFCLVFLEGYPPPLSTLPCSKTPLLLA